MTKEYAKYKAEKRILWAEIAEKKALAIREELKNDSRYNDLAFWSEPIKIGHHSEGRHRRTRERYHNKRRMIFELEEKAKMNRDKAENLLHFANTHKGDAARKDEEKRKRADAIYSVGSKVFEPTGGEGTILKVNKKIYRVKFVRGFTWTRDKSYFVQ